MDRETQKCLESFLTQDYQPYQVLFGVSDHNDPVLPLLETLRQAAPPGRVQVMVCPETLGHNPKVSILRQLEPEARYDLLVVADRGKPVYDIPFQLGTELVLDPTRGGYIPKGTDLDHFRGILPGGLNLTVTGEAAGQEPGDLFSLAEEVDVR